VLIHTLVMTQTSFLVLASLIWASVDITPFRQFALSFPWCHPQVGVFPRRGYGVANALYSSGGHFVPRPLDLGSVKYGNDDMMELENAEVFLGSSRVGAMIGRQE